jgi:hypothetical protein
MFSIDYCFWLCLIIALLFLLCYLLLCCLLLGSPEPVAPGCSRAHRYSSSLLLLLSVLLSEWHLLSCLLIGLLPFCCSVAPGSSRAVPSNCSITFGSIHCHSPLLCCSLHSFAVPIVAYCFWFFSHCRYCSVLPWLLQGCSFQR